MNEEWKREYEEIKKPYKNGHDSGNQEPLRIRAFDEINYDPGSEAWLIEDLLLTGEISLVHGPSNVGKTFWALNAALAIADTNAATYLGRKLSHGNVVYIAAEGGRRIDKRISAWKAHNLYDRTAKLPFWLIAEPVDLCHSDDVERITAAVRSRIGNELLALLTIETVNSALMGGDENDPADMGRFIANVRTLRDEFDCHVMLIHHPSQGRENARGHTSLPAAVDTEMRLTKKDRATTVAMTKQREAEISAPFGFDLKIIQLGDDRDEKPTSSCVVVSVKGVSFDAPLT